jgi:peptidoglycan hydrolase CwlO-like protein
VLLGALLAGAVAYVWSQRDVAARIAAAQEEQTQANQALQTETQSLRVQVDNLQGQLLIEQGTRQGLETGLKQAQAELGQAREKIAALEQLLSGQQK